MAINFSTENQTFRKVMGNGLKYTVPKFQRNYAWTNEQWDDLWQDLSGLEDDEQHYMGYLVLQTSNAREFVIIDGQQRLTTISILLLGVLRALKKMVEDGIEPDENQQRLKTLQSSFIGFTDPVSLVTQSKLALNRNDDSFFRRYLCEFQPAPFRGLKASERLLGKARDFFEAKVKDLDLQSGAELAQYTESIIDKLLFTTITVGSDLNAYKVFETLNARGVQLSVPDLIKNYMFSIIDAGQELHEEEIRKLEEDWGEITGQLKQIDFTRFVHAEWNSKNSMVPKNQLFKRLKQNVSDRATAFSYVRQLCKSAEIYAALQNAHDEFWKQEEYREAYSHLAVLNLFSVTQPHGLLLAAYHHFTPERFVKVIGYIAVITVRYNVIGSRPTSDQERIYNKVAQAISGGMMRNLSKVKTGLKELYPNDDSFKSDFINKHMKTTQSPKKVRYILAQIEKAANSGFALDDTQLTLEHILPKQPSEDWIEKFGADNLDDSIEMIGNMTLLTKTKNGELGNSSFAKKKKTFADSPMSISKKIAEYDEWNREAVENRQAWLADLAVTQWKIEF